MLHGLVTKVEGLFVKRKERALERESQGVILDDVTNLPIKEQHKLEATKILKQGKGKFAYVSCDVSGFKYINETYGYVRGNTILRHIATVLSESLEKDELVTRTTGDHFCMLLHYTDKKELRERVLEMLQRASVVLLHGVEHQLVFNCGVYLISQEDDINKIRARATAARKHNGKGFQTQIHFYQASDMEEEVEIQELETEIRRAVEQKELKVFLQPKYDISSERVIGAEALVRWEHPEKGMLSPAKFVPACEANGFICSIDLYVFQEVCHQMRRWMDEGKELVKVSVNFSRRHLSNVNFVSHLVSIVNYYGLETSWLEIELTESVAYEEMETLLEIMRQIKEAGFGLSMDDFGSGYSSLALLREMPVDVLKLDKGFLDGCSGEKAETRDQRIVSHIISMAKDLNISVLAEGVETAQQKDFLKESNCDMIQGYYYAQPMPAENFEQYLVSKEVDA